MKVTVLNESKDFDNKDGVFEQIQTFINKKISDQEMYFSHMSIDGIDIYHDLDLYIEEHLFQIENIKVELRTASEFISDLISSIHHYVERALPELVQLSGDFYKASQSNLWEKLNDLIEAIQWIHESIMSIDREKARPSNWDKYLIIASSFETLFPNLLEALEAQDNILIADIISYEIMPLFQDIDKIKIIEDTDVEGQSNNDERQY